MRVRDRRKSTGRAEKMEENISDVRDIFVTVKLALQMSLALQRDCVDRAEKMEENISDVRDIFVTVKLALQMSLALQRDCVTFFTSRLFARGSGRISEGRSCVERLHETI